MAISTLKPVLTEEEFTEYTGINLNLELTAIITNDLGEEPASRFIYGIEDWLRQYLYKNFDNDVSLLDSNYNFNSHQLKCFKKGTISQIQYYLQNGTISNDSGYNVDTKQIVDIEYLNRISLAPDAKTSLFIGGFMNKRRRS